jgi:hypothetical protein
LLEVFIVTRNNLELKIEFISVVLLLLLLFRRLHHHHDWMSPDSSMNERCCRCCFC